MPARRSPSSLPLCLLLACVAAPAPKAEAADPKPSVDPQQKQLAADLVGTWEVKTSSRWARPSGPPEVSTATAVTRIEWGGWYLRMDVSGTGEARSYRGLRITSFDSARKTFANYWLDNSSSGPMYEEGTYDPASRTYRLHGSVADPGKPGERATLTTTLHVIDHDHHRVEDSYRGQDGVDHPVYTAQFTRVR